MGCCGWGLCSLNCSNSSGTVPYNPNSTAASAGGAINTAANPLPAPDASGGNGSFLSCLQPTMTQGINCSVVSANEFGLGSLGAGLLRVAAAGFAQPAAAPSPSSSGQPRTIAGFSAGTWLLVGLVAIVFFAVKDE